MVLTKHFKENWAKRVKDGISLDEINKIINKSLVVQKGQMFYRESGQSYNTLSIFWHPDLDLVITVDPFRQTFVSVLSRENWRFNQKNSKQSTYVKGEANGSDRHEKLHGRR